MEELPYELIKHVNFVRRKVPLTSDLRPMQRIAQILLVLQLACYRKSGSVLKLQIFNWAFKSKDARAYLNHLLELTNESDLPIIRFDPALNRAIGLALAEKYVELQPNTGKITVGGKGESLLSAILMDENLLKAEKEFLRQIGKVSEEAIQNLFRTRFKINA